MGDQGNTSLGGCERPNPEGKSSKGRKTAASTGRMGASDPAFEAPAGEASGTGRFAYAGLDRTIHDKARLGILTSLAANPEGLLFIELRGLCSLTDGNLSRHLHLLHEAGFVEVWKRIHLKRSQTLCRLTDGGLQRLLTYVSALQSIVADAGAAAGKAQSAAKRDSAKRLPGWTRT